VVESLRRFSPSTTNKFRNQRIAFGCARFILGSEQRLDLMLMPAFGGGSFAKTP